jgi:hypothetical protein
VFPKEQFGFFPGRSCQQAQFVLRHLAQRQLWWGGSNKRLGIAFIDLTAAYDHVDREALWHHLQHVIGVPLQLLTVIQNMYSGDAYRLVDEALRLLRLSVLLRVLSRIAHLAQTCLRCFSAI